MIIYTANEFTAQTSYDRDYSHLKHSKHRSKDAVHLILRDDRAISNENIRKLLPEKYINDIVLGKLFLIIDFSLESSFHFVDSIYTHIIGDLGVNEDNILLVCSSYDYKDYILQVAKRCNKKPIYCEYYSFFERLSKKFVEKFNLEHISPLFKTHEKLYINLNRYVRLHRVALISLLHNNNLLEEGYNSFALEPSIDLYHKVRTWEEILTEANSFFKGLSLMDAKELDNQFPLQLDTSDFKQNLAYTDQNDIKKYVDKTLISLVTETNFIEGTPLFLTEKIFKPIGLKHPFIAVSRPNTLTFLRSLGYKTFSNIIDESYDLELNDSLRLQKIVNELKRLKNLNTEELKNFKFNALPIVEHNFNVLMNKKTYIADLI